jgi:hypothetical protein
MNGFLDEIPETFISEKSPQMSDKDGEAELSQDAKALYKAACEKWAQDNKHEGLASIMQAIESSSETMRYCLEAGATALAAKDAEIEKMRRVLRCETPEDEASFVANWLRGTIVIPEEVRVRMLPEIAHLQRVVNAAMANEECCGLNSSELDEALAAAQQEG